MQLLWQFILFLRVQNFCWTKQLWTPLTESKELTRSKIKKYTRGTQQASFNKFVNTKCFLRELNCWKMLIRNVEFLFAKGFPYNVTIDRIKWNRYANNKKPDKMSHLYLDLFWHDFPFIFSGEVQLMNYGCISWLHLAKSIWPYTWIEIIRNLLQLCCLIERFLKWRWLVHVLLDLMQLKN